MEALKKTEVIVQSILGLAIVAVLSFFVAVHAGAFDPSDKMAKYAKPLTGHDVAKLLTQNESEFRKRYPEYEKMLARAKQAGAQPYYTLSVK